MDIPSAIKKARPGAKYELEGDSDYTKLIWIGPGEKPTLEELEAVWELVVNPPPPPVTVTKRSLLLKLTPTQTSTLAAWMSSMPEGIEKRDAQIYYRDSTTVSRSHPMVGFFGAALNLDAAGLDALFAAAQAQDQLEAAYLS